MLFREEQFLDSVSNLDEVDPFQHQRQYLFGAMAQQISQSARINQYQNGFILKIKINTPPRLPVLSRLAKRKFPSSRAYLVRIRYHSP